MSKNSEELKEVCPVCKGSGEVPWDFYRKPSDIISPIYSCGSALCRNCKGKGFTQNQRIFEKEYRCVWIKEKEKEV